MRVWWLYAAESWWFQCNFSKTGSQDRLSFKCKTSALVDGVLYTTANSPELHHLKIVPGITIILLIHFNYGEITKNSISSLHQIFFIISFYVFAIFLMFIFSSGIYFKTSSSATELKAALTTLSAPEAMQKVTWNAKL